MKSKGYSGFDSTCQSSNAAEYITMIYSTGTKISELRNMIEESISYVISNYICPFARVGVCSALRDRILMASISNAESKYQQKHLSLPS
jgi:hypothetical protein